MLKRRKERKSESRKKVGKLHVWTLVDMISKEWKAVKDATIEEQKKNIELLKKSLENCRETERLQNRAYNQHVFKANVERIQLNSLIAQLQSQIITLNTRNEEYKDQSNTNLEIYRTGGKDFLKALQEAKNNLGGNETFGDLWDKGLKGNENSE